jgi:hypothetical protein
MLKNPPDFESEFIRAIRRNLEEVVELLDSREEGMEQKMETFCSRFGFSPVGVKKKIRKDKMFRAFFAKDPGKQKIHENIAALFIGSLPSVKNFKQLSNGELQILRGAVMPRKEVRAMGANRSAKTIDFKWDTNNLCVYASHKYTKGSGGGQDNQYEDLQHFIREANESHLKNTIFLAIADGNYYEARDMDAGVTKLQRLRQLSNRRSVFTLTIGELKEFLRKLSGKK